MKRKLKGVLFVSAACLVVLGTLRVFSGNEVTRILLRQVPDKAEYLWILDKVRGEYAKTGTFSSGGYLSPDRKWYAFRPNASQYNMKEHVVLGNVSSRKEVIIPNRKDVRVPWTDPVWSPDSRCLAYIAMNGIGYGMSAIIIYDLASGEAMEILRLKGRMRAIRFWNGGRMIFFLHEPSSGNGRYMLLNREDCSLSAFPIEIPFDHASWPLQSPDGKHIAYKCGGGQFSRAGTFIFDVESKTTTMVLTSYYLSSIVWSPDGRFFAGMLHRPSRNPIHKLSLLYCDNMKFVTGIP